MRTFRWGPTILKTGVDPAVEVAPDGAAYRLTVPAGKRWRVESAWMEIVASADAGNRQMGLNITDGTRVLFVSAYGLVVTAGQTKAQSWARMSMITAAGTQYGLHFPDLELAAGSQIYVYCAAFDAVAAGDNCSALFAYVKEVQA